MKTFPSGVHTVLVTPFNVDGSINYEDLGRHVDQQIENEVAGIVLLGTTSEAPTISREEKEIMVPFIFNRVRMAGSSIFITVGVGGQDTLATLNFAKFCLTYCDALMVTVPNYNKPNQRGIYHHFKAIADGVSGKPIMMYNIQSRTGVNMETSTLTSLFNDCINIVAVKEASGNLNQVQDVINSCDIKVFSGDDALTIPIMASGGVGVVSVASSVIPQHIVAVVQRCLDGDFSEARRLHYVVRELIQYLFIDTNPTPVKQLMFMNQTFRTNMMRLPLVPMKNQEQVEKLLELYEALQ